MITQINIEEAIKLKAPKQYPKIPKWVIRAVERLVCQQEINDALIEIGDVKGVDFACRMSEVLDVHYVLRGEENLPADGAHIFVSNHPLGAFDGVSYIAVLGRRYPKFKVIVNDLLMYIEALQPVFLPVNTLGRQRRADMEAITAAYADGDTQILSFPAGFCSRYIGGCIQDIEWKKSVITQAIESKRDIVPLHFEGRNSIPFYSLEWIRRMLGMKFNIGLLLLPRQMMHTARHKTFTLTVGKPIAWQTFTDNSRTPQEWAQWLRGECYKLKGR